MKKLLMGCVAVAALCGVAKVAYEIGRKDGFDEAEKEAEKWYDEQFEDFDELDDEEFFDEEVVEDFDEKPIATDEEKQTAEETAPCETTKGK